MTRFDELEGNPFAEWAKQYEEERANKPAREFSKFENEQERESQRTRLVKLLEIAKKELENFDAAQLGDDTSTGE